MNRKSLQLVGMDLFRSLPSVEKILQTGEAAALTDSFGRPLTLRAIRHTLEGLRIDLKKRDGAELISISSILKSTGDLLSQWTQPGLRRVINATGVILHTNLGRAPLSAAATAAINAIAGGYSNVELDLDTGKRGGRALEAVDAVRLLTGAEAALVVNNNAAAVLLTLSALAARKRVAIARSQMVEIGGGFRMPDVMRQSGARLVEVGTTNKVRLADYEEVFNETQMVLRAHRSNFKMVGFTAEPELHSIAEAAHRSGQIVVDDLGSGALLDTAQYGLAHEPTVQESLAAGVDIVCFSGDKLLGGPQAGIIIGTEKLIAKLSSHAMARAVRADKITLAALTATLKHYLLNEADTEIPVWQMLSMPLDLIERRARDWVDRLGQGEVIDSESTLGGGSLPGETLPTKALALTTSRPDAVLAALRRRATPVIGRAERAKVLLDPRTVSPRDDVLLVETMNAALMESR
jgi:L-seryl-tRNA(Ser) seleniumtransferase